MASRLSLHTTLKSICNNVYFQPPESVKMTYPCIRYKRTDIVRRFADNTPYKRDDVYELTVISKSQENTFVEEILQLPCTSYSRQYVADNLYHDVIIIKI